MRLKNEATMLRRAAIGLALIFLFTFTSGMERPMQEKAKDAEARNREIVRARFDAWRNGTGGVFDLLAPDAKWTIVGNSPVSRTYTSRREFMDVVIHPFNARLSRPLVPNVRAIYADGDTVIALFDAEGTARDGKPYRNTYTWYLRMRDGAIVEAVAFFDTIEFTDFWTRIKPE
jgi:ketosteroid isomerase-like protein